MTAVTVCITCLGAFCTTLRRVLVAVVVVLTFTVQAKVIAQGLYLDCCLSRSK